MKPITNADAYRSEASDGDKPQHAAAPSNDRAAASLAAVLAAQRTGPGAGIAADNGDDHTPDAPADEPPPALDFPPLDGLLGETVAGIAEAARVPQWLALMQALGIASAAIGKGLRLRDRGRDTPANVFVLVCARSGSGKSHALRLLAEPLYEADREAASRYRLQQVPGMRADLTLAQKAARKAEGGGDREALKDALAKVEELQHRLDAGPPRLFTEDVTLQALAVLLQAQGETLAVISPDAGDVFDNLEGRHSDGKTEDSLWLKGYSGEGGRVDRIGRNPVTLEKPCLAALLVVTPDRVAAAFTQDRFRQGGLLPRCLVHLSAATMPHDDGRDFAHPDILAKWAARVRDLIDCRAACAVVDVPPAVSEVFRAERNRIADHLNAREPSERDAFPAREVENAMRVALVLHAIRHGKAASRHPLSEADARAALAIVGRCAQDRDAFLCRATGNGDAQRLASRVGPEGMTLGTLKNNGWDIAHVRELCAAFPKQLRIETVPAGPKGGRPSERVRRIDGTPDALKAAA